MNQFDIPSDILPELVESTVYIGNLTSQSVPNISFEQSVKVFAGGADNACGVLASGIINNSEIGMVSIETSGVFLSYENDTANNYLGNLHFFNHSIPNGYYSMGVTLSAGNSLSWLKNTFASNLSFDELLREVDIVPVGSQGLIFTPYINAERTPYFDSEIRGSFIGIDSSHILNHFTRSVLEGITFSLKDSQVLMEKVSNKKFKHIVSIGGESQNESWLQTQADIFNTPIVTLKSEHGPGLGAAMIATIGLHWFDTVESCAKQVIQLNERIYPIEENVKRYSKVYDVYTKVYENRKEITRELLNLNK